MNMFGDVIKRREVNPQVTVRDFQEALDIWWIKPQVANRRLVGCVRLFDFQYDFLNDEPTVEGMCSCIEEKIQAVVSEENSTIADQELFNGKKIKAIQDGILPLLSYFCHHDAAFPTTNCTRPVTCSFRRLIPRAVEKFRSTYELVLTKADLPKYVVMFIPLCCDGVESLLTNKSYILCFNEQSHSIELSIINDFEKTTVAESLVASVSWLEKTLLQKLSAWTEAASQSETGLRKHQSLALVDVEAYTLKYSELKKKYGSYFVEIWPENTDALKYVYEDIGIASYLLILWANERVELRLKEKQSFVDVGCGNGLLVHVLSSEGHPGRGIDLRKRKIWDLYGGDTVLQERSLIPNELIVEEDWIIGNHSDELTPWIPIIATRSSYHTRYFVLPCCFFDFNAKFHHVDQRKSHYESYLDYIREIGERCMFRVQQDTLRIPSTKRICQVGTTRSYSEIEHKHMDEVIESILSCTSKRSNQPQADTFTPRSNEVLVRNCSRVKEQTKTEIISKVTSALLEKSRDGEYESIAEHQHKMTSLGVPWSQWNGGGSIHLNCLAKLLDAGTLAELKAQCGGLQTLLKNNRNIFRVVAGMVELRDSRKAEHSTSSRKSHQQNKNNSRREQRRKKKLCWFHVGHPHGCLFSSDLCSYAHGTDELQSNS